MPKIFISHSWEDNDVSRRLSADLKRDGADIWIDYARIAGGDSLPKQIGVALKWCDILLLVWSKSAETSYYVNLEWETALDMQKRIILCPLDETERPILLRRLLYISLQDYDSGYRHLLRDLKLKHSLNVPTAGGNGGNNATMTPQRQGSAHTAKLTKQLALSQGKELDKKKENTRTVDIGRRPSLRFRSTPITLSEKDVKKMLVENNFYDSNWNKAGAGVKHDYKKQKRNGHLVVSDASTGLMWQQSGSEDWMLSYSDAEQWLKSLNKKGFGGHKDWRLPTLEEAMSLMERTKKNGELCIDPIFDNVQQWIWTCDKVEGEARAWVVFFLYSYCDGSFVDSGYGYVRAVRS